MADLNEMVAWMESALNVRSIKDYSGAVNGLQLVNSGRVERVVAAVDASLPVIAKAAVGGGLLLVHHGMFWQGAQPVVGAFYQKLRCAMEADLAIYSSHLPLDVHEVWGNNIQLARSIGLLSPEAFGDQKGIPMGVQGRWLGTRAALVSRLEEVLVGRVHVCPSGPEENLQVGVITGGAGSAVGDVAAMGIDTFVTGEGAHWTYPMAEELGVNLLYGGHYATETFGVKALAQELSERFGVPWEFIDHPTGL